MEISIADQIALDDALVAPANRLKIGKCNLRLSSDGHSKGANSSSSLMIFKMNNKKHILNLDQFRDILQICPKVGNKKFEEPPLEKEILAFLASLGHWENYERSLMLMSISCINPGDHLLLSSINILVVNHPTTVFVFLKLKSYGECTITRRFEYAYFCGEAFIYQNENKNWKERQCDVLSSFHKLVVQLLSMDKDLSIPRRNRNEDTQLYGTILPVALTNKDIRNFESYKSIMLIAFGNIPPKTKKKAVLTEPLKRSQHLNASGSGADEGTGVSPGVPDAPDYDSNDVISWKSSEDDQADDKNDDDENAQDDENDDKIRCEKTHTHDDETTHKEETNKDDTLRSYSSTPSRVSSSDDEDSANEVEGVDVEGEKSDEDATDEEDQGNEMDKDTNANLKGRDDVMTDVILPQEAKTVSAIVLIFRTRAEMSYLTSWKLTTLSTAQSALGRGQTMPSTDVSLKAPAHQEFETGVHDEQAEEEIDFSAQSNVKSSDSQTHDQILLSVESQHWAKKRNDSSMHLRHKESARDRLLNEEELLLSQGNQNGVSASGLLSHVDTVNARAMIQAIDKKDLKTMRIMRSLERFVGGRPYGAGNPVKKILLKLNLSNHRSILTDLKILKDGGEGMSVEEIERVVAQRVANAIEAIAIYETKTNMARKSISQTERQEDKVAENASNKRKWEGNHNGSSSQQNKGHKNEKEGEKKRKNRKGKERENVEEEEKKWKGKRGKREGGKQERERREKERKRSERGGKTQIEGKEEKARGGGRGGKGNVAKKEKGREKKLLLKMREGKREIGKKRRKKEKKRKENENKGKYRGNKKEKGEGKRQKKIERKKEQKRRKNGKGGIKIGGKEKERKEDEKNLEERGGSDKEGRERKRKREPMKKKEEKKGEKEEKEKKGEERNRGTKRERGGKGEGKGKGGTLEEKEGEKRNKGGGKKATMHEEKKKKRTMSGRKGLKRKGKRGEEKDRWERTEDKEKERDEGKKGRRDGEKLSKVEENEARKESGIGENREEKELKEVGEGGFDWSTSATLDTQVFLEVTKRTVLKFKEFQQRSRKLTSLDLERLSRLVDSAEVLKF
ncbi:hypothetical protein Tco_0648711 [Tanacetum coccineum]